MLNQVERREYIFKVPSWITSLKKKIESNNGVGNGQGHIYGGRHGGYGGGRGCGGRDRDQHRSFISDQGRDKGRSTRIINPNQCHFCKLAPNEQYKDIFHPGNHPRMTARPKSRNGHILCLRFHSLGYFFRIANLPAVTIL